MKKKVGRVSDMADKRKNRDFEGNGKRKSQMVKSEKTWVRKNRDFEGNGKRKSQMVKSEKTWVPGKSGKSCEKGTGRQSGKPEGTWAPGKSEKGAGRQSAKPEIGTVRKNSLCPVSRRCGGCQYLDIPYEEQLKKKQAQMQALLGRFCKVYPIKGMDQMRRLPVSGYSL